MARHSSLNELRNLVQLLSPTDLYPCVEDPQKLTYLDLEACFGDVCNLSQCTYLKDRAENKTEEDGEEALRLMLAGRWGYDDISEEVDNDEDSIVESDDPQDPVTEVDLSDIEQFEQVITRHKEGNDTTEDETDTEHEPKDDGRYIQLEDAMVASSQESTTVLCRDSHPTNLDMIQYFFEHARDGGNIRLSSVGEIKDDELL